MSPPWVFVRPVTSRECLVYLPCESSTRKPKNFGSGWLAPGTALRADRIVRNPPAFCQDLRFLRRAEELAVEEPASHLPIKGFDESVLPRGTGFNVERLDLELSPSRPPTGVMDCVQCGDEEIGRDGWTTYRDKRHLPLCGFHPAYGVQEGIFSWNVLLFKT